MNDYGDIRGEKQWTRRGFVTATDIMVVGKGTGQRIRGIRFRQWRPQLIICDDIENDENVESPVQRKKTSTWFHKTVIPALEPGGKIVIVATLIHYDCLAANLRKNRTFDSFFFKAIDKYPINAELWEQWSEIYNTDGPETAQEYYEKHRKEMNKGARVRWRERFPIYELMVIKTTIGSIAFNAEYQNEPTHEEGVQEEWITYYHPHEIEGLELVKYSACDPQRVPSIITIGVYNRIIYVLDTDIKMRSPLGTRDAILRCYEEHHPEAIGIERNAYQVMLADSVEEIANIDLIRRIRRIVAKQSKEERIRSLFPLIESGRIRFLRNQWQLIESLVHHPKAEMDDPADALEMAVSLIGSRKKGLPIKGQQKVNPRRRFGRPERLF